MFVSADCHLLPAVNMAIGKVASQSSTQRQFTADRAVDGDDATCTYTDWEANVRLSIGLSYFRYAIFCMPAIKVTLVCWISISINSDNGVYSAICEKINKLQTENKRHINGDVHAGGCCYIVPRFRFVSRTLEC